MGEIDAYLEARTEWERQASRLGELIALMRGFADSIEHGRPPLQIPAHWPSAQQLKDMADAAMSAWGTMHSKWQAIPNAQKRHTTPLPTRIGYSADIE